ncbi:hypothetical protein DFH09DRAFT_1414847 [Mycena vulgaris]|nr:hypothetical protein DFH09DRAFT_1414847 [Mycena vulgaris]
MSQSCLPLISPLKSFPRPRLFLVCIFLVVAHPSSPVARPSTLRTRMIFTDVPPFNGRDDLRWVFPTIGVGAAGPPPLGTRAAQPKFNWRRSFVLPQDWSTFCRSVNANMCIADDEVYFEIGGRVNRRCLDLERPLDEQDDAGFEAFVTSVYHFPAWDYYSLIRRSHGNFSRRTRSTFTRSCTTTGMGVVNSEHPAPAGTRVAWVQTAMDLARPSMLLTADRPPQEPEHLKLLHDPRRHGDGHHRALQKPREVSFIFREFVSFSLLLLRPATPSPSSDLYPFLYRSPTHLFFCASRCGLPSRHSSDLLIALRGAVAPYLPSASSSPSLPHAPHAPTPPSLCLACSTRCHLTALVFLPSPSPFPSSPSAPSCLPCPPSTTPSLPTPACVRPPLSIYSVFVLPFPSALCFPMLDPRRSSPPLLRADPAPSRLPRHPLLPFTFFYHVLVTAAHSLPSSTRLTCTIPHLSLPLPPPSPASYSCMPLAHPTRLPLPALPSLSGIPTSLLSASHPEPPRRFPLLRPHRPHPLLPLPLLFTSLRPVPSCCVPGIPCTPSTSSPTRPSSLFLPLYLAAPFPARAPAPLPVHAPALSLPAPPSPPPPSFSLLTSPALSFPAHLPVLSR